MDESNYNPFKEAWDSLDQFYGGNLLEWIIGIALIAIVGLVIYLWWLCKRP